MRAQVECYTRTNDSNGSAIETSDRSEARVIKNLASGRVEIETSKGGGVSHTVAKGAETDINQLAQVLKIRGWNEE